MVTGGLVGRFKVLLCVVRITLRFFKSERGAVTETLTGDFIKYAFQIDGLPVLAITPSS